MIRPLRQRHRVMVCTLGVVLPLAFVAGIVARKPVPTMATVPLAVLGETSQFGSVVWERDDLWAQQLIRTRLLADHAKKLTVELSAAKDIARPDLIVYWVSGDRKLDDRLPEDAILLGAFIKSGALPLPAEASVQSGALVLYSLADHEVVAASKTFNGR